MLEYGVREWLGAMVTGQVVEVDPGALSAIVAAAEDHP